MPPFLANLLVTRTRRLSRRRGVFSLITTFDCYKSIFSFLLQDIHFGCNFSEKVSLISLVLQQKTRCLNQVPGISLINQSFAELSEHEAGSTSG